MGLTASLCVTSASWREPEDGCRLRLLYYQASRPQRIPATSPAGPQIMPGIALSTLFPLDLGFRAAAPAWTFTRRPRRAARESFAGEARNAQGSRRENIYTAHDGHGFNPLHSKSSPTPIMRITCHLQLLLATLSASVVARPVSSTQAGPSSATDARQAPIIDLDLTLQHPALRSSVVPGSSLARPIVPESSFQHPSSSTSAIRELEPILLHMPVARSDVVHSMLSTKFNLKSNVPLQRILTPAERAAIRWMSGQHLTMPGVTWLDTVVDEPDFDLRIKKKLYVAAPIMTEELERAVGVHRTSASRHGLLVAFYEALLDEARRYPFRIAGIEMVRDEDEARRVVREWSSPDTLESIAGRLGRSIGHV